MSIKAKDKNFLPYRAIYLFGSFSIKSRAPRVARNPRTGEKVELGSRLLPYFKPGKELNILINS